VITKPNSAGEFKMEDTALDVHVGIAYYAVARAPYRLTTLGLGSCVGVVIYDEGLRLGGLAHIMLPSSTGFTVAKPAKFADTGIPALINELVRNGARLRLLKAKLAGGAQMFSGAGNQAILSIGERNIKAVYEALAKQGIRVAGADVGGNRGRTLIFDTVTGLTVVKTLGGPAVEI